MTVSLSELRLALGRQGLPLRQAEAAEEAGVTQGYLSQVERGRRRPSQYLLARLARVYAVPLDQIRASASETLRRAKAGLEQIDTPEL